VGETHDSNNRHKEIGQPGEREVKDAVSAVLPGALSNEKESATRTTGNEVRSLEEARRQREERFERSIGLEHWSGVGKPSRCSMRPRKADPPN
jgi:hypothetical protein